MNIQGFSGLLRGRATTRLLSSVAIRTRAAPSRPFQGSGGRVETHDVTAFRDVDEALHPMAELEASHAVAPLEITLPELPREDLCSLVTSDPAGWVGSCCETGLQAALKDALVRGGSVPQRGGCARAASRRSHGDALVSAALIADAVTGNLR